MIRRGKKTMSTKNDRGRDAMRASRALMLGFMASAAFIAPTAAQAQASTTCDSTTPPFSIKSPFDFHYDAKGAVIVRNGGQNNGQTTGLDFETRGAHGKNGANGGVFGRGHDGDPGGSGSSVLAINCARITTTASGAHGVSVLSIGGDGGTGGNGGGFDERVGHGAKGGDGGNLDIRANDLSVISTFAPNSHGINAYSRGGEGGTGGDGSLFTGGGSGAVGGNGGDIAIDTGSGTGGGSITTYGNSSHAIHARTEGGFGGRGGDGAIIAGGSGGSGGDAGNSGSDIIAENHAALTTTGYGAAGMMLESIGGQGGTGGNQSSLFVAIGASGGVGGNSGFVNASNSRTIQTYGKDAIGISAKSIGGGGGNGGDAFNVGALGGVSIGGSGGGGGHSAGARIVNRASVITGGQGSYAIQASSIAGGGGDGGRAIGITLGVAAAVQVSIGGKGGNGGDASPVEFEQKTGTSLQVLQTGYSPDQTTGPVAGVDPFAGDQADAVLLQSIGGGGGSGGRAIAIAAAGNDTPSLAISVGIGGSGGNGGNGSDVGAVLDSNNLVHTSGRQAQGVVAQSIGGGGGHGGNVITVAATVGTAAGAVSVGVGGTGGRGGSAGKAVIISSADVRTMSDLSSGLVARSVGGGGGSGGNVVDVAASLAKTSGSFSVGVGGTGGGGGTGDAANLVSNGRVQTDGNMSHGLVAQSLGGGGGSGGNVHTYAIAASAGGGSNGLAAAASVSVGGSGGTGNVAGRSSITQSGSVVTSGDMSHGAYVQSIGGGGGDGGNVFGLSVAASLDKTNSSGQAQGGRDISATVAVGGSGGTGGRAGSASFTGSAGASTTTNGVRSHAVFVQSLGGGGGNGGNAHSFSASSAIPVDPSRLAAQKNDLLNKVGKGPGADAPKPETSSGLTASVAVGGKGGSGNVGGDATVVLDSSMTLTTHDSQSYGVFVQSIGGGGGSGGHATSDGFAGVDAFAINMYIGGTGGSAGHSGTVKVTSQSRPLSGGILTEGEHSHGILAQSIGGGGGESGQGTTKLYNVPKLSKSAATISIGGSAGASGDGGLVEVAYDQRITTKGAMASAIMAQSVGGGGGVGASTTGGGSLELGIGGSGGASGHGGAVKVIGNGALTTSGDLAHAIVAQSVGGGGGIGGNAGGGNGSIRDVGLKFHLGGDGTNAGDGGDVTVTRGGSITTSGNAAFGILAQSVGGGGGINAASDFTPILSNITGRATSSSANGNGGRIVIRGSDAPLEITTSGANAHAVFAQSVGGGGGLSIVPGEYGYVDAEGPEVGYSMGGDVSVSGIGRIATSGHDAHGIYAESMASAFTLVSTTQGSRTIGRKLPGTSHISIEQPAGGTIRTSGSNSHGIFANGNSEVADGIVVSVKGAISNDGMGSWGVYARNGDDGSKGRSAVTTRITVADGAQIRSSGISGGGIRIEDHVGRGDVSVAGLVLAKGAKAIQTYAPTQVTVERTGIVQGSITTVNTGLDVTNRGAVYGSVGDSVYAAGTYTIADGGRHWLAVDPQNVADGSDSIHAAKVVVQGGRITPYLTSLPGTSFKPVTVMTGSYDGDLSALIEQQSLSTTFRMDRTSTGIDLTGITIDFTKAGLDGNQGEIARMATGLIGEWTQSIVGSPRESLGIYLLAAANAPTKGELSSMLDHFDASGHFATVDGAMLASSNHLNNMQSCGTTRGPNAAIAESECTWAKVVVGDVERRNGDQRHVSTTYAMGQQREIGRGIFVGLNAAYEDTSFRGVNTSSKGERYHLGAIGKLSRGPLLASVSGVLSYGTADGIRFVPLSGTNARSDQKTGSLATRLRAMYLHEVGALDVFPILELDMALIDDHGYQETGGGAFDLKVHRRTHFLADLRPAIRFGSEVDIGGSVLRGYAETGARFALNDSSSRVSLANVTTTFEPASLAHGRDRTVGTLAAGASLNTGGRIEISARYEAGFGKDTLSHVGSLKVGLKF